MKPVQILVILLLLAGAYMVFREPEPQTPGEHIDAGIEKMKKAFGKEETIGDKIDGAIDDMKEAAEEVVEEVKDAVN